MSCSGLEALIVSNQASENVHVLKPRSTVTCPCCWASAYAAGPHVFTAVAPGSTHVDQVASAFTRESMPATVAATRPPCEKPTSPGASAGPLGLGPGPVSAVGVSEPSSA